MTVEYTIKFKTGKEIVLTEEEVRELEEWRKPDDLSWIEQMDNQDEYFKR